MKLLLALLLASVVVSRARPCPLEATKAGAYISVAAYRINGTPIGSGTVSAGERVLLQAAAINLPFDPVDGSSMAAIRGGSIYVTVGKTTVNVTPIGGVPILGQQECGGEPVARSLPVPYVVTASDARVRMLLVRANYTNGIAGFDLPVRAVNYLCLRVRPSRNRPRFPIAGSNTQGGVSVPRNAPVPDVGGLQFRFAL